MDIASITIDTIREDLAAKRYSAEELAAQALAHAEAENPKTNAYLKFSPERAIAAAKQVDARIAQGEDPGPEPGARWPPGYWSFLRRSHLQTRPAARPAPGKEMCSCESPLD